MTKEELWADDLEEIKYLKTLVWLAYHEMNAIRAATGSPRGFDGYSTGVSQEWWSKMVDAMDEALGDKDAMPWPAEYMKPYIEQISGRPDDA